MGYKLDIVSEWETGSRGCKAIARNYEVQPCQLFELLLFSGFLPFQDTTGMHFPNGN
jgi:hypothetical protein